MSDEIHESTAIATPLKLDMARGNVLQNVVVLSAVSRNGRQYTGVALLDAAGIINGGGVKVYLDHEVGGAEQRGGVRSVRDLIGVMENARVSGGKVKADFRYLASARKLIESLAEMPKAAGFSVHCFGPTTRIGDVTRVDGIREIRSVDLVTDAATTSGLFESDASAADEAELLRALREGGVLHDHPEEKVPVVTDEDKENLAYIRHKLRRFGD